MRLAIPSYSGSINVDGRRYTVVPADFAPSQGDLRHVMQGLSIKSSMQGAFDWELAVSGYDYSRDLVRSPTVALPAAALGGAGRVADQHGTGWNTFALRTTWRPQGIDGAHQLDLGLQQDAYQLRTLVSDTGDWLRGTPVSRFSAFSGDAEVAGLYAQDSWRLTETRRATLGLRVERWQGSNGAVSNAASTLTFAERTETFVSPKAAMAWQLTPQWELKTSLGRAVRFPTVAELYQGSIATNVIVNNDPNLKPEKSWTGELTAERVLALGSLRTTLFHEDTHDALYSQTNVTVTPNVTNIQNVDHIRTSGLELAYQATGVGAHGLDLMASLTYAHSRIVENANFPASVDKWQPRVPEWRANAVATYHFGERWLATLGARYSGKQFNTLDNADPNGFAYTGVSSFFVVDARVRYVGGERWNASLGIDNLNNEEYWNFHPYTQRTLAAEIGVEF
jgi:iron complex outermembrane receptor protein